MSVAWLGLRASVRASLGHSQRELVVLWGAQAARQARKIREGADQAIRLEAAAYLKSHEVSLKIRHRSPLLVPCFLGERQISSILVSQATCSQHGESIPTP
jgi:uracil DNA glycosylase